VISRENNMIKKLKELIYGKGKYNLEIKPVYGVYGTSQVGDKIRDHFENKVIPAGKKKGYLGKFIVTEKNYLIKGEDNSLEKKTTTIDLLSEDGGILELNIVNDIPVTDDHGFLNPNAGAKKPAGKCLAPHIHLNDRVYRINKNLLGKYLD
jgi:hypothetical protein